MISDEEVERAVDFLRESAAEAGRARAARHFAEEYRKSMKALIMSHSNESALGSQERYAYAHADYIKHLESIREAVLLDETMRAKREAAQAMIQAWQTQSANLRGSRI